MDARHVVHTVGPVYHGGKDGEAGLLVNAYRNNLHVALETGCKTIAFPSISTGAYGYPIREAAAGCSSGSRIEGSVF
jgi:O-acetyl-ADP-ribose deacetylase (regulator of RNase III)